VLQCGPRAWNRWSRGGGNTHSVRFVCGACCWPSAGSPYCRSVVVSEASHALERAPVPTSFARASTAVRSVLAAMAATRAATTSRRPIARRTSFAVGPTFVMATHRLVKASKTMFASRTSVARSSRSPLSANARLGILAAALSLLGCSESPMSGGAAGSAGEAGNGASSGSHSGASGASASAAGMGGGAEGGGATGGTGASSGGGPARPTNTRSIRFNSSFHGRYPQRCVGGLCFRDAHEIALFFDRPETSERKIARRLRPRIRRALTQRAWADAAIRGLRDAVLQQQLRGAT